MALLSQGYPTFPVSFGMLLASLVNCRQPIRARVDVRVRLQPRDGWDGILAFCDVVLTVREAMPVQVGDDVVAVSELRALIGADCAVVRPVNEVEVFFFGGTYVTRMLPKANI